MYQESLEDVDHYSALQETQLNMRDYLRSSENRILENVFLHE